MYETPLYNYQSICAPTRFKSLYKFFYTCQCVQYLRFNSVVSEENIFRSLILNSIILADMQIVPPIEET